MKKIVKYIVLSFVILICVGLVWYIFFKENNEIVRYKEKFKNQISNIDIPSVISNNEVNVSSSALTLQNSENQTGNENQTSSKQPNVIIISDTEMLNQQGKEILEQISKELEETFSTISDTPEIIIENEEN